MNDFYCIENQNVFIFMCLINIIQSNVRKLMLLKFFTARFHFSSLRLVL